MLVAFLAIPGVVLYRSAAAPPAPTPQPLRAVLHQRTPREKALWEARWYRAQAVQAVNRERSALLERLPPEESERVDGERWRRGLMAQDRSGDLHRARTAGRRAAALARTPGERFEAALWLSLIECDSGRHDAELQNARLMMQLKPADLLSLSALHHGAACNRLKSLERQTARALKQHWKRDTAAGPPMRRGGSAPPPTSPED